MLCQFKHSNWVALSVATAAAAAATGLQVVDCQHQRRVYPCSLRFSDTVKVHLLLLFLLLLVGAAAA
jgi:hypothetical protein